MDNTTTLVDDEPINVGLPTEDDTFLIQDFTTVSTFERLARQIEKQLRSWDISESSTFESQPYKYNSIFRFDELAPGVCFRLSATNLKSRKDQKFFAKASKYQRWFGLRYFNALEVLNDDLDGGSVVASVRMETANTLLNAMVAAGQALKCPDVPVFICKDAGPRDEHIGFQFEGSSPLRHIEYHSVSIKNGNHLIARLSEFVEEAEKTFRLSFERLIPLIVKELHLAALYLYFIAHMRLKLDTDLNVSMRWVHVIENCQTTQELLTKAPLGLSGIQWNWRGGELLPIRSLHIFLTWHFDFWDSVRPHLTFEPSIISADCFTISLRPLSGLAGFKPLFGQVLTMLYSLLRDPKLANPLERLYADLSGPAYAPLVLWRSLCEANNQICPSRLLSPGDALLLSFIASLTGENAKDVFRWEHVIRDLRLICEAGSRRDWLIPMVIEPDYFLAASPFPFNRALDSIVHVMRQKYLREEWERLYIDSNAAVDADELFISLYLTPHPPSVEYSLVLEETWNAISAEEPKVNTSAYQPLYRQFYNGSLAYCILERRRHSIPTLPRFLQLWHNCVKQTGQSDFDFYRLAKPNNFQLDNKMVIQELWNHVTDRTLEETRDWKSLLFGDITFEMECALNHLEHVAHDELISSCFDFCAHIFVKTLCDISIHSRGSPTTVTHVFKSHPALAPLLSWDPSVPPVEDVMQLIRLSAARYSLRDGDEIDPRVAAADSEIMALIDACVIAEQHCLSSLALLSKLPSITPSLIREILYTVDTEEIVVKNPADRKAVLDLILTEGYAMSMSNPHELLPLSTVSELNRRASSKTESRFPLPFLKEFIFEYKQEAQLYTSWHEEEFRLAWKLRRGS